MIEFLVVSLLIVLGIGYYKYSTEIDPYIEVPAGYIDEELVFHAVSLKTLPVRQYEGYNILTPKTLLQRKCNNFWINTRYRYDKNIHETYIPMKLYPNSKEPLHPYMLFSVYVGEVPVGPFGTASRDNLTHEYYIIQKDKFLYLIHRYTLSELLKNKENFSIIAATLSSISYSEEHFKALDRIR